MRNGHMLARAVSIKVNPGSETELTRILEQDAIPLFRSETDFLGLLAFIRPDGREALSLSLWDKEESAGAFCPADLSALTALAGVNLGTPSVQVYEVSDSTLHTMEEMLGKGNGVEATTDLKVYQACATINPIVARTVHNDLRFPAGTASYEFNDQGNPILCRPNELLTVAKKQLENESHASVGEGFRNAPGRLGNSTQSEGGQAE